ncbi:helix-turn-helix transcriptional regulator [Candidatus Babeliales bacterium]|nr:helix-turn-helix transcriptional regulator [Candidatus Babeliales bacterium]
MKRKKGFYSISVVAKMFSVHQQTVRMYEKEGFISPKRTDGNTRLFSEEDVDRLEEIINLTHNMGVNLAGVQIILRLQKKIKKLQSEINKTFEKMHGNLEEEGEIYQKNVKEQGAKLLEIKKQNQKNVIYLDDDDEREPKKNQNNITNTIKTLVDAKPGKGDNQIRRSDSKLEPKIGSKIDSDDDWEIEYED